MLLAAVDTSTLTLSCAVLEVGDAEPVVLATRTDRPTGATGGHGARLPGALVEVLEPLGKTVRDVDAWAVGLGPGSFTGLRIGLATWKGLAYANRRPIAGASSLAAMALDASLRAPEGTLLVPLLDAKKGEVYAGFYRGTARGVEAVLPEAALPPGLVAARVAGVGPALAFGEGYAAFRPELTPIPELDGGPATPSAEAVARLVAPRLGAFEEAALFALEPHYVRPSEAEVRFPHGLVPAPRPER
ncbi:MAG TPA: tRNA (adenosine(37)-N6)-threonylcarbamoyltransferase complex dimerization subunit type 1 TsaB [Anaeromyxobacteraceae bacterium]|nr:tRNA (adenosine(37)-N6)-threonylcarbamoyltransferase complex dimerization subunit type 1 TsaB [Anaeromyxobacteraceae bacterium]